MVDTASQTRLAERLDAFDLEILRLLADGATGDALARRLRVPPRTIQRRIQHLRQTLHVNSTIEAVVLAVREGLV